MVRVKYCRRGGRSIQLQLQLKLKLVSKEPRIFHIENLLSDAEAEHLVRLAVPHVARSQVGSTGLPGDVGFDPLSLFPEDAPTQEEATERLVATGATRRKDAAPRVALPTRAMYALTSGGYSKSTTWSTPDGTPASVARASL